jgi:hypothetical protein
MEERLRIILLAAAVRLALAPFFMHAADLGTLYESSAMVLRGENVYAYVYGRTLELQGATGLPVFFEGYAYHPLLVHFFVPFYWFFTLIAGSSPVMISANNTSMPTLIYPWTLLLVLMLKMPQHMAIGTSLGALLPPVGLLGAWEYYRHGDLNVPYAIYLAIGILIGAYLGSIVATQLSGLLLRRAFAVFLIIIAARLLMR